jgi:hypothetical protein
MKFPTLSLLVLVANALVVSTASAEVPTRETMQVARVLINSPEIVQKLKANISEHLTNFEVKELERGVLRYNLRFVRQCECLPSTAEVTIIEDLRPTEIDAPAKYTSSIKITRETIIQRSPLTRTFAFIED